MDELFARKKPNAARLKAFGFRTQKGRSVYTTQLLQGRFTLEVSLDKNGVHTALTDNRSHSPYVLHLMPRACGKFVGQVKQEYEQFLRQLEAACFEHDIFKTPSSLRLIDYVRQQYGGELEYLWKRFPNNAIWRRADNAKWYGAMLTVPASKLGLKDEQEIEILDFRAAPADIAALVDGAHYFPGYHMNKAHWLTVRMDGSVPLAEIKRRLDESYRLAGQQK